MADYFPFKRRAMSEILEQIYTDHINISRLLNLLELETGRVARGEAANYCMMADIVHYIAHYFDVSHHTLEDQIFAKLVEKDNKHSEVVEPLTKGHKEMPALSKRISDLLAGVADGAVVSRDWIVAECHYYIRLSRAHMRKEEAEVLPLARQMLDDDDWAEIAVAITMADDPLFGKIVTESYRALYDVIIRQQP